MLNTPPLPSSQAAVDQSDLPAGQPAWTEFLQTLRPDIRILDASTHSHLPARIAASLNTQRTMRWTIHALHAGSASPPPARETRHSPIQFQPAAADGRLPFADASIQAVCEHYPVHLRESSRLLETHRVLMARGEAQFLIRHAHSAPVIAALQARAEADLIVQHTAVFEHLHALVTMRGATSPASEQVARALRHAISTLKSACTKPAAAGEHRLLAWALGATQALLGTRQQGTPEMAGKAVQRTITQLDHHVEILNGVLAQALDDDGVRALEALALRIGFVQVESMPRPTAGGAVSDWQLMLVRP